ncbi:hypothetical protein BGZ73_006136 [Actinomortierella ambigua]|nr:hypothetical protein BGZ73_006136 [Actinomortierella ambigua]
MRVLGPKLRSIGVALTLVATASVASATTSPPVTVSIHTPWAAPPLLLEILESVAVENRTAYYPLLKQLVDPSFLSQATTPMALYEQGLKVVQESGHVTKDVLSTLKLSLAVHSTSAGIQAHYQLYNSVIVPERSKVSGFDPACPVWVDWYGLQVCDLQELKAIVAKGLDKYRGSDKAPTTMELDQILPNNTPSDLFTILYANVLDPAFEPFHQYLTQLAEEYGLRYSLRYVPPARSSSSAASGQEHLSLAGFGAELALKSTDYLVIDDRDLGHDLGMESSQKVLKQVDSEVDLDLGDDETPKVEPLTEKELKGLGYSVAQHILESKDPLKTLVRLTRDLPKYQRKVLKSEIRSDIQQEISANSAYYGREERNRIWLNGQPIPQHKMNPFNLLRILRSERRAIETFKTISPSEENALKRFRELLINSSNDREELSSSIVFDVRDKSKNAHGSVVTWLNDLVTDKRYKDWSDDLYVLYQPARMGSFPETRHNYVSALFAVDLSSPQNMQLIASELSNLVQHLVPVRFGVLPLIKSQDGDDAKVAMLWRHVLNRHGLKAGLSFLQKTLVGNVQQGAEILAAAQKAFEEVTSGATLKDTTTPVMTAAQVLAADSVYRGWTADAMEMAERFGVDATSMFVNGKHFYINGDHTQRLIREMHHVQQTLAALLREGKIKKSMDLYEYALTQPGVFSRRNRLVFINDESNPLKMVDLSLGITDSWDNHVFIEKDRINELAPKEQDATLFVVADFDSAQGIQQAAAALAAVQEQPDDENHLRVALVHNGDLTHARKDSPPTSLGQFVSQLVKCDAAPSLAFWKELLSATLQGSDLATALEKATAADAQSAWVTNIAEHCQPEQLQSAARERHVFLKDSLKAKPNEMYLVLSGRVIGPLTSHFSAADIQTYVSYERQTRLVNIEKRTEDSVGVVSASAMMKISSLVYSTLLQQDQGLYDLSDPFVSRYRFFGDLLSAQSKFSVNTTAPGEEPWFHFQATLDPLSELGQKWAHMIEVLSKLDSVQLDVLLLPHPVVKQPPKRFYRYVLDSELRFDPSHGQLVPPAATFHGMPESSLLTLGVDVMPAWVVTSKSCIHDMDNLKLESLSGAARRVGVVADFELQHILVEGFARDITQRAPPKGAQFLLGTKAEPHVVDTLVMANMGYFQLKGNPGVWEMSLRPGRTQDIFEIESIGADGWLAGGVKDDKRDVIINNLEGMVLYPRLVRKPGMENANVQDEAVEDTNLWNTIKSSIKNLTGKKGVEKKKADINIFSVASGHLYERFLSIMILSVMKNTESRVKFWFIENFLSPSFKDLLPHMAEKYDFDFELVTYKWPHWLRAQTEKQRIIWAYKILFLDVLFPLDLDKVIFVDADQIVRTDMKELVDLDLHGAPYGYTPMCNDRKEMEGFRFWNQGYWKDHLRGKPYHISALYVVDLVRFRQLQAGDQLRNHYHGLSADPNSLANLDQDLPNNMQSQVPIFSLPQEWLWCETWCSDEGLKKAKTIDLCNNPMTKEPKLDRARRQIKEWEEYDNEATAFARQVASKLREEKAAAQSEHEKAEQEQQQDPSAAGDAAKDIPRRDEL